MSLCLTLGAGMTAGGCVAVVQPQSHPGVAPGYGYMCYAGFYTCKLSQQVPVGTQCSCPGLGAPSYGSVR